MATNLVNAALNFAGVLRVLIALFKLITPHFYDRISSPNCLSNL